MMYFKNMAGKFLVFSITQNAILFMAITLIDDLCLALRGIFYVKLDEAIYQNTRRFVLLNDFPQNFDIQ